jgi:hypothetical protein
MIAQQITRSENQIVEVELSASPLVITIALKDRSRFIYQSGQNPAGSGLHKRVPRITAGGVVNFGRVVQTTAIGF